VDAYRPYISSNFTIAKVISIFAVVVGHYFGGITWVAATIGLFIFGFSSGYFSHARYTDGFSKRKFWRRKLERLAYDMVAADLFLLVLFLLQGRSGIFTWHSMMAVTGLSGWLTWFGIYNQSPYGHGLWFFTLLINFYLLYPWVERMVRPRIAGGVVIAGCVVGCLLLHRVLPMGHMLWLTAASFLLGVYAHRMDFHLPSRFAWSLVVLAFVSMALFRYGAGIVYLNYLSLFVACVATVLLLLSVPLPAGRLRPLAALSPYLLEIYLLHTYLFVRSAALGSGASFAVSLLLTLLAALVTKRFARWLRRHFTVTPVTAPAR